ncbi:hypothetical protein LTR86_000441 [Recurvomyces mirabilis]|nr:hypothetical protein LTR86_000441 [Recurvomyces mirabilis]
MKHDDGLEVLLKREDDTVIQEHSIEISRDPESKAYVHSARVSVSAGEHFAVVIRIAPHFRIYSASGIGVTVSIGHGQSHHQQTTWIGKNTLKAADNLCIESFHLWARSAPPPAYAIMQKRRDIPLTRLAFTMPSPSGSNTARDGVSTGRDSAISSDVSVPITRGHLVVDPIGVNFAKGRHNPWSELLEDRALTEAPFHHSWTLNDRESFESVARDWASPLGGANGRPYIFHFVNTGSLNDPELRAPHVNHGTAHRAVVLRGTIQYRDNENEYVREQDGNFEFEEESFPSFVAEDDGIERDHGLEEDATKLRPVNVDASPDNIREDVDGDDTLQNEIESKRVINTVGALGSGIRKRQAGHANEYDGTQASRASHKRATKKRYGHGCGVEDDFGQGGPVKMESPSGDAASDGSPLTAVQGIVEKSDSGAATTGASSGLTTRSPEEIRSSSGQPLSPPEYTERNEAIGNLEQHTAGRILMSQPPVDYSTAAIDDEEDEEDEESLRLELKEVQLRRKLRSIERRKKREARPAV